MQSRLFQVAPATVSTALYLFLGLFKVFWLVFNIVPYVALQIIGGTPA